VSQLYEATERGDIPVDVDKVKGHLKIEHDRDDELIGRLMNVAVEFAEAYTARELRANTWKLLVDEFEDRILLRRHPVSSITSVKHLVDDVWVTVSSSDYYLKKGVQSAEVLLVNDAAWPTDTDEREHAVEVVFVTAPLEQIDLIVDGIHRHVAHLYENRGDCDAKKSAKESGATTLYDPFRIPRV
jgi:uncharacterized phiE125 gp8 family phage protein